MGGTRAFLPAAPVCRSIRLYQADVEAKDILGYTPRHFCTDRLWQKLADDRGGAGRK